MNYERMTYRYKEDPRYCGVIDKTNGVVSPCSQAVERLTELEDKIEGGLLVDLPCKVGDAVYMLSLDRVENGKPIHKIIEGRVFSIQIEEENGKLDIWLRVEFGVLYCCRKYTDFIFDKVKAEEELRRLNNGES